MKIADFPHLGLDYVATHWLEVCQPVIVPTGSRYNCDPPVRNTDEDYLVFVSPSTLGSFNSVIEGVGYVKHEMGEPTNAAVPEPSIPKKKNCKPETAFASWRKDKINLIVTSEFDFFDKHRMAGYVCKKLNVLDKEDRIMVYAAIVHGYFKGETPNFPLVKDIDFLALNKMFATQ